MAFSKGFDYVNQALEEGKRRAEGGNYTRFNYFNWKPGDKKILRFLDDDIITENFAEFIMTNTGQTMNFMVNPDDPGRLDRYRSPVPGIGWRQDFKTKVLEEPKLRKLTVGIAVLREEVPGPDGKLVLQDYLYDREIKDKDGNVTGTAPSRFFGIVQQSVPNFWHTLAVSCFKRYGTICDRDYEITRSGTGFDTKYDIIPLPEDPDLSNPEVVKQFYFYGAPYENDDPERFLKCTSTLQDYAEYFSGEERYKFWLAPKDGTTTTPSGMDEYHPATTSNPVGEDEAQAAAPSGTNFSSLKDTLLRNAKP